MSAAIVCLCNDLAGHDGTGPRVARALSALPLPDGFELIVRPNLGLDVVELLERWERLVIVDAMTSGRPAGTCLSIDLDDAAEMASCPGGAHTIGIPELLQIVLRLFPDRPRHSVRVVAVEGLDLDTFGVGLSEPVARALPDAVERVVDAAGLPARLVQQARAAARREATAPRTVHDVICDR